MLSILVSRALLVAALLQSGTSLQIPAPRGLVNDFANVLSPESAARIERMAQDVRSKSKGEIAVVTLPDLGGRDVSEIALRIGREWKVGNLADIGDKTRNAGVVILLVPKETASDGRGRCRIETGQGAEGFLTDATAGDICREATPAFAQRDYGAGLELVTQRVAQRFAQEYGFALDSGSLVEPPVYRRSSAPVTRGRSSGINPVFILLLIFIVFSFLGGGRRRGCGGCIPIFLPFGGFGGGGGGFGGGGGGFGGGGGGGFGGFGGGGGFSGGGGGSSW